MGDRVRLLVAVVLALIAGPIGAQAPTTYGAGVTMSEVTQLNALFERPASFEGKTVRVEGVVTAVCATMGCWMGLGPANSPESVGMLVKVDHGVIMFPLSAKGHRAAVQGVVQRAGIDAESREAAAEYEKETAILARFQIKATGAVVY